MSFIFQKAVTGLMAASVLAFTTLAQAAAPLSVPGAATVNTAEAKKLWDSGAVFIDSRKKEDWEDGHIAKAIHLDRGDRENYTREKVSKMFKKDQALVTYCYGKVCTRSSQMAADLVSVGYTNVYFYREGFPGWSFGGHPIESE
jgi:rhodanese-related sulfurtransferase